MLNLLTCESTNDNRIYYRTAGRFDGRVGGGALLRLLLHPVDRHGALAAVPAQRNQFHGPTSLSKVPRLKRLAQSALIKVPWRPVQSALSRSSPGGHPPALEACPLAQGGPLGS